MAKQMKFEWCYQPLEDSLIANVLSYIQNRDLHPSQTKKDLMLKAVCAFYTAQALSGQENSPEILLAVKDSLHTLFDQFIRMCAEWKIDPASVGGTGLTNVAISPSAYQSKLSDSEGEDEEMEVDDFETEQWNASGMSFHQKTY